MSLSWCEPIIPWVDGSEGAWIDTTSDSCAYVACGRLTGYYEETGFVDTAAGILLVEEAGGIVTDWWGRGPEVFERTGALIVANPSTHTFLLEQLRSVPRKDP
jgi:myo-inositol-1(or 4)-monophosphatase